MTAPAHGLPAGAGAGPLDLDGHRRLARCRRLTVFDDPAPGRSTSCDCCAALDQPGITGPGASMCARPPVDQVYVAGAGGDEDLVRCVPSTDSGMLRSLDLNHSTQIPCDAGPDILRQPVG